MQRSTLFALCSLAAASHLRAPPLYSRLRGGDTATEDATLEAAAEPTDAEIPPAAALTRDEIMAKLNGVPVFCITNKDGGIIGMTDAEGGKQSVCWFTDADEARGILKAMSSTNPAAGLRLACHGLGGAFTQCNGWQPIEGEEDKPKTATSNDGSEVELRLQGNHQLVRSTATKLVSLLEDNGFDPGCWQHPVFICDQLGSASILPVFLHPKDLAAVWTKSGRDIKDLPQDVTVLDIRMLVSQMQTDANPWSIFHLVASPEAIKLSTEIAEGGDGMPTETEGAAAEGAPGAAAAASATASAADDVAGVDDIEDEDEEVVI